jgi:hypothetical protein
MLERRHVQTGKTNMETIAVAAVMLALAAQPPTTESAPASAPAAVAEVADQKQGGLSELDATRRSVFLFKFDNVPVSSAGKSAVAEPAALVLLLGGLGLVGAVMRRRARLTVTYS